MFATQKYFIRKSFNFVMLNTSAKRSVNTNFGDLIYKFRSNFGNTNFSEQIEKIITRYKNVTTRMFIV